MIPFPNLIAGILIGATNSSILSLVVVSVIWGFVFVIYTMILGQNDMPVFLEKLQNKKRTRLGLSPRLSFYVIEYITGVLTALIIALVVIVIKDLV
jgi:hypothetical protein